MKGRISLKEFIHGVKNELLDASASSTGPAAFEMTEVELEAEFVLDTSAKAEGSFAFFVKVEGEASASQSHKVKIKLAPIKQPSAIGFAQDSSAVSDWSASASAIGTPSFHESPPFTPAQGFPFVQLDPTRVIFGASSSKSIGTSSVGPVQIQSKADRGDA